MNFKHIIISILSLLACLKTEAQTPQQQYDLLQSRLMKGWHTYNHTSVLSYVYMPGNFSVKVSLKNNNIGAYGYMGNAYMSAKVVRPEKVYPISYSANGDYSEVLLTFEGAEVIISCANVNNELYLTATPVKTSGTKPSLVLESGLLWNAPGTIQRSGEEIIAQIPGRKITVKGTKATDETFVPLNAPYLSYALSEKIGVSTNSILKLGDIEKIIEDRKVAHQKNLSTYKDQASLVNIIQNAVGFNTTYDPLNKRIISPVSRYWSEAFGGPYVLFDWDTYFGSYMASLFNKDLAYSNAIAITKSITPGGFIPNYASGGNVMSGDRSQPPVGSTVIREIYRKHPEKWFLEYVFDDLLTWNRWWIKGRTTPDNLLCWGSDSVGDGSANTWQAAAYESGLDNSPMYIGVPFNEKTHKMELADVGLQSLYIMDCEALADIASILGKKQIAAELTKRAGVYRQALAKLWDNQSGQYLNYRTDLKTSNPVTSPTNFYPFLIKAPQAKQADKMLSHLKNPEEYYGEWIIPSTPKNNPFFKQQDYWKGRIWAPLNFLVYLGVRQYNFTDYRKDLVKKSARLLEDNYKRTNGYVFENYNAISGLGRNDNENANQSDNFYHWGALLGFISVIDAGHMGNPLTKISK